MKILKRVLIGFSVLLIVVSSCILFYPEVHLNRPYNIAFNDENGQNIYSKNRYTFGEYVPLEQISEPIKKTIIAIEDQRFYSHQGLDYQRILKSAFNNLVSFSLKEGASTITQQLARLTYLSNEKSFNRKISEALIAKKIEMSYSKNRILEMYLNSVFFGHNLYGIHQASLYYFNKLPKNITYKEASILVGIINAPALYSPEFHLEASEEKSKSILSLLLKRRIIDQETYISSLFQEVEYSFNLQQEKRLYYNYYEDGVYQQIEEKISLTSDIKRIGLSIDTYQNAIVSNKIQNVLSSFDLNDVEEQVSIVIMKPGSGEVLSLFGGNDYTSSPFNRALFSKRQIGSTIKPLLYYLGLISGMNPLSEFYSGPTSFLISGIGEYSPSNASGMYANRPINMVEALGLSDNIYATKTTLLVGSKNLADLISSFNITVDTINPTLGLGTTTMSPLELTSIYNTFASSGIFYKPQFVKSVKLINGRTIYKAAPQQKRILKQDESVMMAYLMRAPFDESLQSYTTPSLKNYQTNKRFAAKTGSTEATNFVIGFNPNYTIGVYVGTDTNETLENTRLAKKLFQSIANVLTEHEADVFFAKTNNLKEFTLYNTLTKSTSFTYLDRK